MATGRKINSKVTAEINTGFGVNTSDYGGRFVNKDGWPNIIKTGIGYIDKISWYHTMLQMNRWKFFGLLFVFYILINLVFAIVYYKLGIQYLEGAHIGSPAQNFGEAYFFSAQTFTTVGYGRISPHGFAASSVAALEALIGLLCFAIATGLFYGRFSKPKAFVRFSKHAMLAPFKDGLALMVRVVPYKNNSLTEAEAKVTVGMIIEENGVSVNRFFNLQLEYKTVNALTLSWTIVHPINESSPFYNFSLDDWKNTQGEIIVYLKAFDDMFSNTVTSRTSYTMNEIVLGAKFLPMYHRNEKNKTTVLDIDKLDAYTAADISHVFNETTVAAN